MSITDNYVIRVGGKYACGYTSIKQLAFKHGKDGAFVFGCIKEAESFARQYLLVGTYKIEVM